jgi:hypothetical protein
MHRRTTIDTLILAPVLSTRFANFLVARSFQVRRVAGHTLVQAGTAGKPSNIRLIKS